jgi:hypothetical protein
MNKETELLRQALIGLRYAHGCWCADPEAAESHELACLAVQSALASTERKPDLPSGEWDEIREALSYGRPVGMGSNRESLIALARLEDRYEPDGASVPSGKHGRHCKCSPCQAEDWNAVDRGLRKTQS